MSWCMIVDWTILTIQKSSPPVLVDNFNPLILQSEMIRAPLCIIACMWLMKSVEPFQGLTEGIKDCRGPCRCRMEVCAQMKMAQRVSHRVPGANALALSPPADNESNMAKRRSQRPYHSIPRYVSHTCPVPRPWKGGRRNYSPQYLFSRSHIASRNCHGI